MKRKNPFENDWHAKTAIANPVKRRKATEKMKKEIEKEIQKIKKKQLTN